MKELLQKAAEHFHISSFFSPEMDAPDLAGDSNRGLVRRHNEDSYIYIKGSRKTPTVAIVADGIGGHHNGDIASGLLVRLFLEKWRKYIEEGKKYSRKELELFLNTLFLAINDAIAKINKRFGSTHPMGTTLSAVAFYHHFLISCHSGDSRLYRIRAGKIRRMTNDHSIELPEVLRVKLAQEIAERVVQDGKCYTQKSRSVPRHMITRAIGTKKGCPPEYNLFRVKKLDRYILCSDGLFLHLSDEEICEIVQNSSNPGKAVNRLINTALQRGGKDNVTIIGAFFN
ncbi:MAG: serine/threonine-protein phosphatase [Lentisphaeria bacterium]|nr:serine/threonine-protein phosphatase [Lentisphaeria bacterium]